MAGRKKEMRFEEDGRVLYVTFDHDAGIVDFVELLDGEEQHARVTMATFKELAAAVVYYLLPDPNDKLNYNSAS